MTQKRKGKRKQKTRAGRRTAANGKSRPRERYDQASQLAEKGEYDQARAIYQALLGGVTQPSLHALVRSDLAVLDMLESQTEKARAGFEEALSIDEGCEPARTNLSFLLAGYPAEQPAPLPHKAPPSGDNATEASPKARVAVLSFLFNWPSTGGGIVHTVELARFLSSAGYDVRHFYVKFLPWGIGGVGAPTGIESETLEFDESSWHAAEIQSRVREAVTRFDPDYAIIADSWNFKPLLAEAVAGIPYFLRLQALECLCPLNNVRFILEDSTIHQCDRNQLSHPDACRHCLRLRGSSSGGLHQAERQLAGVGTEHYDLTLRRAFLRAQAVLVVNPVTEAIVSPHACRVRVITAGMDPARFPWTDAPGPPRGKIPPAKRLLFAGLESELIKGYAVLHEACRLLWSQRQDFELVLTSDPPGRVDEYTQRIGWLSQAELPLALREADICVVPAVAQEALGRTAVEAGAAGRPVVASHIGGLPFTVKDGKTGLLFEPGNPEDLAAKLTMLLDDPGLRQRLGTAGRRRFEREYSWDIIIEKHYRPLLTAAKAEADKKTASRPRAAACRDVGRRAGRRTVVTGPLKELRAAFPWPEHRPEVEVPRTNPGWFADGARSVLARELTEETSLVIELGAWLGLSTRYIADCAPNAVVVTVDHWQGSREHQSRTEYQSLLPRLYETFLMLSWKYRDRIIPVRDTTVSGLQLVANVGVSPDLIFVDADHRYDSVLADIETAHRLFPDAMLVGDDYDADTVRAAAEDFASGHKMTVEPVGSGWRGWKVKHRDGEETNGT